jgi:ketosteroid isomerase-like protein
MDNLGILRSAYDALVSGDIEALVGFLAPDVSAHVPGRSQVAGDYRGLEQVLGYVGNLTELSGGTLRFRVHDLLAGEEHGVVLINDKAEREGRSLDLNNVHAWHLGDGKLKEIWIYPGDVYAWDDFWGS